MLNKVVLVYPALYMQTALALSVATLAGQLKNNGFDVKVFDTALYQEPGDIDENRERAEVHHSVGALDYGSVGIVPKSATIADDFASLLDSYKPDVVALSAVESNFGRGIKLTRIAKARGIPVIAGGVFPTLATDIVLSESSIDLVCIGEGERGVMSGCKQAIAGARGVMSIMPPLPLNEIKYDFSVFGEHMFYKPMQGKLFRTLPIETSRGCPYQCTYCAEPAISRLYRQNGMVSYRKKSMARLFDELADLIPRYRAEFLYFATETFLAMDDREFDEFVDGYKGLKLPFWIQTRPETITKKRLRALKDIGMHWLTIGIECGNEDFRSRHLKRRMKNSMIEEVTRMLEDIGQGASFNSIIGFPFETRELMMETIMFNRRLYKINQRLKFNISLFTPFRGCELYKTCVDNGLLAPVPFTDNTNIQPSMLTLPNMTGEELSGLYRAIPLYVYLSDAHLHLVHQAERDDSVYHELNGSIPC